MKKFWIVLLVGIVILAFGFQRGGSGFFSSVIVSRSITNSGTLEQTGTATFNGAADFNGLTTLGLGMFGSSLFTSEISLTERTLTRADRSSTTVTLPAVGAFFVVNDTTQITRLLPGTGTATGRIVILYARAVSRDTLVDGVNLKLAGNYSSATNSSITLLQIDTNFVELCRAAP